MRLVPLVALVLAPAALAAQAPTTTPAPATPAPAAQPPAAPATPAAAAAGAAASAAGHAHPAAAQDSAAHAAMHATHQGAATAQGTTAQAGGLTIPGWTMRLDKAGNPAAKVTAVTMGKGYHFTSGPAAIYYDAENVVSGSYTAKASFTQTKAPMHPEAYGLFVGGKDLQGDAQRYLYFIVRGDGKYAIKHRLGSEVHTVADWAAHTAVKTADAQGKATNALEVRADAQRVRFLVNGVEVKAMPRAQLADVDGGVVGLRVNHMLDLHVDGFAVTPSRSAAR